jgi:hypothetical protein
VLTTCQPSTVWCSRERLPAAAAQPAQGSSDPVAPRIYFFIFFYFSNIMLEDMVCPARLVKRKPYQKSDRITYLSSLNTKIL